jgi:hypothetical protein
MLLDPWMARASAERRRPLPSPRRAQDMSQILPHLVNLPQNGIILGRQSWSRVDDAMMRWRIH